MSQKNRPSQYDWFKGSSNKNNPNHRKDQAKTVWKFTKIFLFFSLFFFTMWGCVQTFIVKTNPKVGQGLELYSSKETISPKVSTFEVATDSTNDLYSLYGLNREKSGQVHIVSDKDNIWVSKKENPDTFNLLHEQFAAQGVTDLSAANKGTNAAYRVTLNGAEKTKEGLLMFDGKPIVASTALNADAFWSHTQKWGFDSLDATHAAISNLTLYKVDPNDATKIIVDKTISLAAPASTHVKDVSYARVYINSHIARALMEYNSHIKDAITKDFSTVAIPAVGATNADGQTKKQVEDHLKNHNFLVNQVLNLVGGPVEIDKTAHTWGLNFSRATSIVGYYNDTSYTAISTWGQAWEMGRGSGPFFGIFVYPLSWVTNKLIEAMPILSGWESLITIIVVVVAVSIIMFSLTFRGTLQQTKMQELSAKKAVIDAKYEAYKGNKQMDMRKRQEIQELYKKEGISPLASMGSMFITIPFFLAMWRTVGSIQHIKATIWLGINFAATSWRELFAGEWQYLLLMAVTLALQVFSAVYTRILTKKRNSNRMNLHQKTAMKKGNKTQNITIGITCFITIILSAGLQIYFIVRSLWRIFEIRLTHHIIIRDKKKRIALGK